MMSPAEKRRKARLLKRKKIITRALRFILIVAAIYALIFLTPFFKVNNISVEGISRSSAEDIISASGIRDGEHMLKINKKGAKSEIEKLAYIKKATVDKKFPNKVKITVEEAQLFANVAIPGGYASIDKSGKVMEISHSPEKAPYIYGVNVQKNDVGLKIVIDEQAYFDVILKYIEHLNNQALPVPYQSVTLENGGVWADLENGVRVYFGNSSEIEYKTAFFAESLRNAGKVESGYFDVSSTDKVIYSPYLPGQEPAVETDSEE